MKVKVQTKQLWETCYDWLEQCGINVHKSYCKEEVSTHPDYPALTSVIDFLESGGMSYHAVKANVEYVHEFVYPVLAHIQRPGQEHMHIVPNAKYWEEQPEITQHWSGIVVVPTEETIWSTNENTAYLRNTLKRKAAVTALSFAGLALFALTVNLKFDFLFNIFGFLSLAGILVSILLLANELGFQSQIIKQVCGVFSESGCEHVMKSSYGKGILGLTPADACFIYFFAQFTLYIITCTGISFFFSGILNLAIAGIAVIMWSLYIQAIKLKVWCALCLAVVAILGSQTILVFFMSGQSINSVSLIAFMFFYALFTLLFLPIKSLIKINRSNKIKLAELKKWKSDGPLFLSQWQQEQLIDNTDWLHDLVLGSIHAPLRITVACNPYCQPCAKAHRMLDSLLERHKDDICVQIRLMASASDANNKLTQATRAILQKAAEDMVPDRLQDMLASWFQSMDLQLWTETWKPDETLNVQERIEQHQFWMSQSQITYTPTLFLNGRKIPGRYSLEDIEFLLPQLLALLPPVSNDVAVHQ